jgi:membrane protein DedA with SNARE-associated domain/rhodanese-related sulfurtransferase
MESWLGGISRHAYGLLFAFTLLEAVGFPIPAALALLFAGAAAANGSVVLATAAASAFAATMLGDLLLFFLGRRTGWWLLGILCRLSFNPDSCMLQAARSFHKRGRWLLVFAKFIPGINTMAPPLAGSMNMRFKQFLALDLSGALLYTNAWLLLGFAFSGALDVVLRGYHAFGRVMAWIAVALVVGYLAAQLMRWRKSRILQLVPSASAEDAARELAAGAAVVYDVRSHGYYDRNAVRVKGSLRLDPNTPHRWTQEIDLGRPVYLYCTCLSEATSARVALELLKQGVPAMVILGGLSAWKKAGLPLEPVPPEEVAALPVFDA